MSFIRDPFNDVDALILALLSYLPFEKIVPGIESSKEISLKDAAREYFVKYPHNEDVHSDVNATAISTFDSDVEALFKLASSCPRFAGMRMSKFEEIVDFVVGRQFAAVTFTLHAPEHKKTIAFRGTDNSFVGWKEDFQLAYMEEIPAQESALSYLERTIGLFSSQFIVCGQSKGGNLAIYAGSHFNPARQNKLAKIINFDGPGFNFSIVPQDRFLQYKDKIINYVPEESMIGLLLDSVGKRTVVSSAAHLIFQHDSFNWQVDRTKFIPSELSNSARILEQTLKTWLTEISLSDREMFLEALFDILGASTGNVIKLDPLENLQELKNILQNYSKLDKETKALLSQVYESLRDEVRKSLSETIKEKLPLGRRKSGPEISN